MTPDLRRYVGVPAAARALACSPQSVRKWVREGKLPAVQRGSRILIHPDDLAAFVTAYTPPRAEPAAGPAAAELLALGVG